MKSDLFTVMKAVASTTLADVDVTFENKHACCVVVASDGYPSEYKSGFEITIPDATEDTDVYSAGVKLDNEKLVTAGGRVVGAVGVAETLENAIAKAYDTAKQVRFENAYMRSDIGARAMKAYKNQ
jgi:phosphoribosylamine--glycine ligase